jgi:hypothetical protein
MSTESCGRLRRDAYSILVEGGPTVDTAEIRGWGAGDVLARALAALDPPATPEECAWMRGQLDGAPPIALSRLDRAVAELARPTQEAG